MQLKEEIPGSDDTEDAAYIKTLLGGDYLTVAHCQGIQCVRRTAEFEKHRLDMFLPTVEDWHAKLCFLITFFVCIGNPHGFECNLEKNCTAIGQ